VRRYLPIGAATVALMVAALAAGCGSSSNQPVAQGGPHLGQSLELADCTDWEQGSTEDRLGTIAQLRGFAGGPVVGGGPNPASGTGKVLDDKQAYSLLDSYCKNDFARGFKLYKLYERAASFSGHVEQ
jgi:hypothetical protein